MWSAAVLLPALPGRSRPANARADLSKVLPAVRCTARKQNGEPCRAKAARGANVCRVHGGSAPQVKAAAKRRLDQAAEVLVQRLLAFALDGDTSENVALHAIIAALDRAGLSVKQALELSASAEPKPYEEMLMGITGIAHITRGESRARRGLPAPETPELPAPPAARELPEVVDAELVPAPTTVPPTRLMVPLTRERGPDRTTTRPTGRKRQVGR